MDTGLNGNMAPANSLPPAGHPLFWRAWIILRKELRESFRDRRTLFAVLLGPLVVTPGIMIFLGHVTQQQIKHSRAETVTVGLVNGEGAPGLTRDLRAVPQLRVETLSQPEAEARIRDHKLRAAVVLPPRADALLANARSIPVVILDDPGSEQSGSAAGRLRGAFQEIGRQIAASRLVSAGVNPELIRPFQVEEKAVSGGGSPAMLILSMLLPYVLIITAFGGGIHAAMDQVAGEKERGTLETLLVSPASRQEIVLGKFGAIAAVCLLSGVLSVVGLALTFQSRLQSFGSRSGGGAIHLAAPAIGLMLLVMALMAIFFAGLLLAISTFARNPKEAQSYLGPLFIVVLLPAMMSMLPGSDPGRLAALVPIYGASTLIKHALGGIFDPVFIILTLAASMVYAAIAVAIAIWLFSREDILMKA